MAPTFKITEQVRDVLVRSSIDATSVKLPPEHLDRALYVAVDKVLKAAGGKWDRKAGAHLFDRDPREALGLAIETGEATNLKQQFQAFYTPAPLAARMAELADVKPGMLVLEPSAGMGALAEAVNAACPEAKVIVCEFDPVAAAELRRRWDPIAGVSLEPTDFLTVEPVAIYDRVVLNPPFTKGQDIAHVTHALKFLKPGGRLVALTAPGWQTAQSDKAFVFRGVIEDLGADIEEVPAGTFSGSGTEIRTVLLVIDKPAKVAAPVADVAAALQIQCPACTVPPNAPCRDVSGPRRFPEPPRAKLPAPHPERLRAARDAAEEEAAPAPALESRPPPDAATRAKWSAAGKKAAATRKARLAAAAAAKPAA